ncbi:probable protein phosphatase 2C 32 [Elaeis guineensis]|uniref:protein-serine/threonine phosphatase n=1 Tax=Elaeis guineensis var. tenera TaxID=51953 RepID=A0A6I9SE09_ELAGV|nr:probable protein phosphatase 2C 32 [Elaeis guineensis]
MSCSVAISSSPVFSPSRIPLSCKSSPETLSLTVAQHHLHASEGSPSASPMPCSTSPFRSRSQRGAAAIRAFRAVDSSSPSPPPTSSSSGLNSVRIASLLKRKRPARIHIPLAEALTFAAPVGSDGQREVEAESERFSVYCKRGRKRLEMEDRHKAELDFHGDPQLAFFGIFDGHGGNKAAEFASEKMGERIVEEVVMRGGESWGEIEEAVKIAYLKTDAEFLKQDVGGGTCCVTALIRKGDLFVSNCGDCRAVLSRAGTAEALTSDHRPSREDERERIENFGGFVDYCRGTWRLQGCLAVSRGIGDSHLKQWVIPEPETKIFKIEPDCEFLILASDGLWDKVGNQEAVDIARPLCIDTENPSLLSACKRLADVSAARGSVDDTSVMIIKLQHFV